MPVDKQKGSTNQPITPALSSRFRSTKTPVAPRLAASSPASPAVTARRDLREQPLSPPTESHSVLAWNGNITPRSGARNTRISTESPASPASTRRFSGASLVQGITSLVQQRPNVTSPGVNPHSHVRLATKASSPNLSTARRASGSSSVSQNDEPPTKFIRANDARPVSTFQSPKTASSPRPLSTTFLKTESPRAVHSAPPSAIQSTKQEKDQRFVRANETHLRATQTLTMARKQSNASLASMNTSRTRSPEVSRSPVQTQPRPWAQASRQASPQKPNKVGIMAARQPTSPQKLNAAVSPPAVVSPSSPSTHRRSFGSNASGDGPTRPFLHRKSASVSSFGPITKIFANQGSRPLGPHKESIWALPTVAIPLQQNAPAIPSPDTLSPRSASLASSKTMGTSVTSDTDASEISKVGSLHPHASQTDPGSQLGQLPQSQPPPTPLAQMQINAANARRERKVLDLEISNSSLLAINKTLEKELRKQSAELRRFRRLSRSGRLSFAPSHRSVSGQSVISLDTLQEQVEDVVDESDEGGEEDEDSDTNTFDDDDDLREDLDENTTARARRRARDERRLMLDLSKHQQLLVDSQKLTQSIKKCLNMSEDLIKEGKQALKYKVGIGDLNLGGRVLSQEDFDVDEGTHHYHGDRGASSKALLSPSLSSAELQQANLWLVGSQNQAELINHSISDTQEPD